MICPACHGNTVIPIRDKAGRRVGVLVCPECGGCGLAHCCEGDRCEPAIDNPVPDL